VNHSRVKKYTPLSKSFYEVTPLQLARKLVGTILVRTINNKQLTARIVETEAYGGADDPASHAYSGLTDRNKIMFNSGGYSYVYFTYGMHYCFNVVAGRGTQAGAVLIRAAEPLEGIEIMIRNRQKDRLKDLLSGPAKLCQAFSIDKSLNGLPLDTSSLFLAANPASTPPRILTTPRIGIKKARYKKWRFVDSESEFLSVRLKKV